ncbi:short chain dehydrogenase [Colletotrichum godetiae]|uniref:Short chain dehydrogenase n=1 Tax=Colletotrichum godetiae TaxID=1209918 RepID=A0AAJ0EPT1_9PEZI|nr:short chain dehydrogenase [Colletotrichum godetiae]KAK1672021.1 short chain dehydrogenase [Colletotrichum godetiae]
MPGALLPLRARHCLVTGAYGGIGAAIASRFAAEGALVTLLGRKEDKLRDLCAQLPPFRDDRLAPLTSSASASSSSSEAKPAHSYAVMDVSADARDEAVLDDIWKRTGQIDVLVNAAGIAQFQLLQNTSPQTARELIDTNLMGTIFMSRYMAQRMKRRRADRDGKHTHTRTHCINSPANHAVHSPACIINVASLLAEKGSPGTSVYAASKAGIIGLTHALSVELGPLRIRTNAIVPGYIETNMLAAMSREPLEKRIPLGRLGRPDEVADAAVFLAQNTYANNCILNLDGGLSAV